MSTYIQEPDKDSKNLAAITHVASIFLLLSHLYWCI